MFDRLLDAVDKRGINEEALHLLLVTAGSDRMLMCAINFHPGINYTELTMTEMALETAQTRNQNMVSVRSVLSTSNLLS